MATIWICGATGAMGRALAQRLHARGDRLILTARDAQKVAELAQRFGSDALAMPADLRDCAASARILDTAQAHFGPVTGMAHCVGAIMIKPLHLTRDDDWRDVLNQNLDTAFHALRAFIQSALGHGQAAGAVLVGSVAAAAGLPNHEAVSAAKAAVGALARSAAATYASKNIRVNCVHPGLTDSEMSAKWTGNPGLREKLAQANPMGRIGSGDDTAAMIAFLLSDEAAWITGQQIGVDGGHGVLQRGRP